MLVAYTGTVGSGKTYHAVRDVWERVKYGHDVITNIPMEFPKSKLFHKKVSCETFYNLRETFEITPKYLIEYSEKLKEQRKWKRVPEDYIYLVIDEAQLIFNCRNWNAKDRQEWINFFTLHRKLGYHIILIAQSSKMLDNQMRALLEYEIIHRKFSNFGLKGTLLALVMLSPIMFACVRVWYAMNERIDCEILRYNGKVAKMYDTAKMYGKG